MFTSEAVYVPYSEAIRILEGPFRVIVAWLMTKALRFLKP